MCSSTWHPGKTCEEHGKSMVKRAGTSASLSGMFGSGNDSVVVIGGIEIKRCPVCNVPIERDTGCAQMMCKRCKHVFCWYCLESLDVSTSSNLMSCWSFIEPYQPESAIQIPVRVIKWRKSKSRVMFYAMVAFILSIS